MAVKTLITRTWRWALAKESSLGCSRRLREEDEPISACSAPVRLPSSSALVPFSSLSFTNAKRSRAIATRITAF